MNDDGQLRAIHLILDFEPISRSFLDVGNSIRVDDYCLARIDVSKPINNKKPKNSQKLIKNLKDPRNEVDRRQGIDQNYYQKRNRPKQSLNFC